MRQAKPSSLARDLAEGLRALICEQAAYLARLDWSDPEAIALAEKRGRIIQVHRNNVEKTLGMHDDTQHSSDPNDPFDGDTDALRRELERRLRRHADALGRDELVRRIRARGLDPAALELGVPRASGPEAT